ncbi:MAG: STAS-like domain-containing protein [Syntrophales bacterium]
MEINIDISKEFSTSPGGRTKDGGPFSGEEFREKFLEKHFDNPSDTYKITIIMDGTYGYATSFLEEAFGGLARKYGKERVNSRLEFVSKEEPLLIEEIKSYING